MELILCLCSRHPIPQQRGIVVHIHFALTILSVHYIEKERGGGGGEGWGIRYKKGQVS